MNFASIEFIVFLIGIVILYYISSNRKKSLILLVASVTFYGFNCGLYVLLFILGYFFLIFLLGWFIDKYRNPYILTLCVFVSLIPLVISKYLSFFFQTIMQFETSTVFVSRLENIVVPLGISFFSLQAVSYIVDIYKNTVCVEKNVINFYLYMSMFMYITSGPIERARNILPQIEAEKKYNLKNIQMGFFQFIWGLFLKIVIAERLAVIVNHIYDNYTQYAGIELIMATISFSLQLYFDFAGYSNMAIGLGKLFSISICQNFEQPYFSVSIAEFWRRWHISLSGWLRDYIYIPCGGNRKGNIRKYLNLMITFLVSGLWHGASLNYLVWGGLHGIYQICESITVDFRNRMCRLFKIKQNVFSYRLWKRVSTFVLVSFAWIFFRAPSLEVALKIIKRIIWGFSLADTIGVRKIPSYGWNISIGLNLSTTGTWIPDIYGIDIKNLNVLIFSLLIAFIIGIFQYKKVRILDWFFEQNLFFRYALSVAMIFFILTFGFYGSNYNSANFIYSNF